MKGKFLKGMGKGMAMLLAAAMLFTSNGVTTLAAGLEAGNASETVETATEDEILLSSDTASDSEEENTTLGNGSKEEGTVYEENGIITVQDGNLRKETILLSDARASEEEEDAAEGKEAGTVGIAEEGARESVLDQITETEAGTGSSRTGETAQTDAFEDTADEAKAATQEEGTEAVSSAEKEDGTDSAQLEGTETDIGADTDTVQTADAEEAIEVTEASRPEVPESVVALENDTEASLPAEKEDGTDVSQTVEIEEGTEVSRTAEAEDGADVSFTDSEEEIAPASEDDMTLKGMLEEAFQMDLDGDGVTGDAEVVEEEAILTDTTASGSNGGVSYVYDGTTLSITITGDRTEKDSWPWNEIRSDSTLQKVTVTDTSGGALTSTRTMFYNMYHATEIDVSGLNTSNVTDMTGMFYKCQEVTKLDLSSFNTEKVTSMASMFYGCEKLTSLTFPSTFTTENCTQINSMFQYCVTITSLDLSGFDFSNVSADYASSVFDYCNVLTSINTPVNVPETVSIALPTYANWWLDKTQITALPQGKTESVSISTTAPEGATIRLTVDRNVTGGTVEIKALTKSVSTSSSDGVNSIDIGLTDQLVITATPDTDNGYTLKVVQCSDGKHLKWDYAAEGTTDPSGDYTIATSGSSVTVTYNDEIQNKIKNNETITATFEQQTTSGSGNGTENGNGEGTVTEGNTYTLSIGTRTNCSVTFGSGDESGGENKAYTVAEDTPFTVTVKPTGDSFSVTKVTYIETGNSGNASTLYPKSSSTSITSVKNEDGSVTITIPKTSKNYTFSATAETSAETSAACTFSATEQPKNGKIEFSLDGSTYTTEAVSLAEDSTVYVRVTPADGYIISKVSVGDTEQTVTDASGFTFQITADGSKTVSAEMTEQTVTDTHILKVEQPTGGSIKVTYGGTTTDGASPIIVNSGEKVTVEVAADFGYRVSAVSYGSSENPYTDEKKVSFELEVSEDITLRAEMTEFYYTITVTQPDNGTISVNDVKPDGGKYSVQEGKNVKISVLADEGNDIESISDVTGDKTESVKVSDSSRTEFTLSEVSADHSISAEMKTRTFTVTVTKPDGCTITANGAALPADGKVTVEYGQGVELSITADEGKKITGMTVDGEPVEGFEDMTRQSLVYTVANVKADTAAAPTVADLDAGDTYQAETATYKVTVTQPDNGSIVTTDGKTIKDGIIEVSTVASSVAFKITAGEGKIISDILVGDKSVKGAATISADSKEATYTLSNIMADKAFTAVMEDEPAVMRTVTLEKTGEGEVTLEGASLKDNKAEVENGTEITVKAAPADGYKVSSFVIDGKDQGSVTEAKTTVSTDITVKVTFAKYYTVGLKDTENGKIVTGQETVSGSKNITVGGSQVTVSSSCEVMDGSTVSLTFVPDDGYMLGTVLVNGEAVDVSNNTCLLTVEKDLVVEASFKKDVPSVTITISSNLAGGTVTASPVSVTENEISVGTDAASEIIKITADDGYEIRSVSIDGEEQKLDSALEFTYEFKDFTKNHTVTVEYAESGLTLKLDGIGDARFEKDKDNNLTTSANLIPSDSTRPYIGAIFGGWYTGKDGTGTLVIDRTGALTADALQALTSGTTLYARWQKITLVERQKISVAEYFQSELEAFRAANPKAKNKYRYAVYTQDSLNGKFAADTKSKIGSVTKKGVFTAKYAGVGRIYLETYDAAAKTYVKSGTYIDIAVEKLATTKLNLCYAGETAELGQYLTYSYADVLGYTPQSGDVGDLEIRFSSSKPSVVSVDEKTGKLTAVGSGTAKIKVTYSLTYQDGKKPGTVSKTVTVTVKAPKLASASMSLRTGAYKTNKLKNLRAGDTVTWTVADPSVATIDAQSGQVTAVSAGETVVTAHITYASGKTDDTCQYAVIVK